MLVRTLKVPIRHACSEKASLWHRKRMYKQTSHGSLPKLLQKLGSYSPNSTLASPSLSDAAGGKRARQPQGQPARLTESKYKKPPIEDPTVAIWGLLKEPKSVKMKGSFRLCSAVWNGYDLPLCPKKAHRRQIRGSLSIGQAVLAIIFLAG